MLPVINLGVAVPAYPLFVVMAFGAALVVLVERARRDGQPIRAAVAAASAAFLGGLAGARAWSALFELWPLTGKLDLVTGVASSGLSVMGGVISGAGSAALALAWMRRSFVEWAETAAPAAAAAVAVARMGCLLAGCCHGVPTLFPIAIVYTRFDTAARPIGVPLHATQIYEGLGCAAVALVTWFVPRGARLGAWLVGYGAVRAAVEPLRGDWRGLLWGVPATSLAAWIMIGAGIALLALRLRQLIARRRPVDPHTPAAEAASSSQTASAGGKTR